MTIKDIDNKIADIEKLRDKAIEERKKLDAKIKEYNDNLRLMEMQKNNAEMAIAVKTLNELGGGNGTVTISGLVELIRNNPQGITALMDKSKGNASDAAASSSSNTEDEK